MKQQIIFSAVLIIVGVMLGFFVVVNWQLAQAIKKTEVALAQDGQRLDAIEKYLSDTFAPAGAQQQADTKTN